ncbi:MAG: cryptochrome/photolyase family protein [Cryomorphaceae bacterium]|nr:cryptochrome/photolyase family protein [Cryomorphaceae bacterium]
MRLRLILGDQLNHNHSWYTDGQDAVYVLMEMRQETDYACHHIQKIVAFFSAMRAFSQSLITRGHQVHYLTLNDPDNTQSLTENLEWLAKKYSASSIEYQQPDEYRLDQQLIKWSKKTSYDVVVASTEHFLTERNDLADFFKGKKMYLMESFYRMMRKKHNILMQPNGDPEGGTWNYDKENRGKLPAKANMPPVKFFQRNVSDLYEMIESSGVNTIGRINSSAFIWPVTREEGMEMLEWFCENALHNFGKYQDAMHTDGWSLYHSRLSFLINAKILSPLEVVKRTVEEWHQRKDEITLPQIEGFVRQIIGWREYMRGIYWAHMPEYAKKNELNHQRKLPDWFWTGETDMNCLKHAINQSLDYAYAHHIQRLMVTGNFALLAGIHPDEVDAWYLGIYIDAIEWVEITNTRGMSQFADGGIVGTKPYVSSANYIKKMSNYCDGCKFDPKKRHGEGACPFNSLYWHFYDRHRDKLANNPRIGMMYRTWDKMDPKERENILSWANGLIEDL